MTVNSNNYMKDAGTLEQDLEKATGGKSVDATTSIYQTLEDLENGEMDAQSAYLQILEAMAYDIFRVPKK